MTAAGAVSARLESFSESTTKIAGGLGDAVKLLEHLQRHAIAVTAADDPLTTTSFTPAAGSPEQRLLDAIALRSAVASVMENYGAFVLAMGRGDDEGQLEKRRHLLEAAAEELHALAGNAAGLEAATAHLAEDAGAAQRFKTPTAHVARLEAIGAKVRGILGMVAKMAGQSTAGSIAGGVGAVSDGVTGHVRQEAGMKTLGSLIPDLQGDVENLAGMLVDSAAPLTSAADDLAARLLAWTNAHRPKADDGGRASYNLELQSLLADARQIGDLMHAVSAAAALLPEAHADIGRMAGSVPSDGQALKSLVARAEQVARRRR